MHTPCHTLHSSNALPGACHGRSVVCIWAHKQLCVRNVAPAHPSRQDVPVYVCVNNFFYTG